MAIESKILCDGCGKLRGETNRWWIVSMNGNGTAFISQPMHEATPEEIHEADFHLCGEACAVKKFSEFLRKAQ